MYSNGSHDHDLNRKIDKILALGQPSGDPVLDDLATTVPQANPDFQDHLETDLIARLHTVHDQHRSKNTMNAAIPLPQATTVRRLNFAVPATLVAAMLAVVVMGTLFVGMNRPGSNFTAGSQISATNTPTPLPVEVVTTTPIPTIIPPADGMMFPTIVPPLGDTSSAVLPGVENALPVVVARDDLPVGTVLTADMLTFAYYPAESAPEAGYTRLEDAIGITLANFVPRGYPITPILISSSENTATPIPFGGTNGTVPSDTGGGTATPIPFNNGVSTGAGIATLVSPEDAVVVNLPLKLVPVAGDNLANVNPGAVLDVVAAVMYIDAGTVDATPVYQVIEPVAATTGDLSFTTVYNAIIVEVVDPFDVENGYVTLSLAPDQAVILNYLIEAHVPMYLSRQPIPDVRPIEGLHPTWVPTATPFPATIPACQVELSQEGKLYTTPNKNAWWIDGMDTLRMFGLLNIIHDQDGNLWYQVQTEDGQVTGWIRETESKLIGENCAADGLLLPATPVPGAGMVLPVTATPVPAVICQVIALSEEGLIVRSRPTTDSARLGVLQFSTPMNVTQQVGGEDGRTWYFAVAIVDDATTQGWVREDSVRPQTGSVCPPMPEAETRGSDALILTATPLATVTAPFTSTPTPIQP